MGGMGKGDFVGIAPQQIAKALSRLPIYQTEEFADFGERYSLFIAWKKVITESEFDCYYWEDAY